jgi:hypothetical protein
MSHPLFEHDLRAPAFVAKNRLPHFALMRPSGSGSCAREKRHRKPLRGNQTSPLAFNSHGLLMQATMGRALLLWLLGVPIPIIILLWLFFGH